MQVDKGMMRVYKEKFGPRCGGLGNVLMKEGLTWWKMEGIRPTILPELTFTILPFWVGRANFDRQFFSTPTQNIKAVWHETIW